MSKLTITGTDIAYRHSDGAGRDVVFVHGNSSSSGTWRHLLDGPFGQRHRCFALDLPGHGASPALAGPTEYSAARYASILREFVSAVDARDAVIVGWSLGGHVVLEAAPGWDDVAGLVIFGTPPIATSADSGRAFLPNPAVGIGFTAEADESSATAYAEAFVAPGAATPLGPFVADILATDPAARTGIGACLAEGRFTDEVAAVAGLRVPLAILHGEVDSMVSLPYLTGVTAPTLWRGAVQVIEGVGHAPHEEAPERFASLLDDFLADLG